MAVVRECASGAVAGFTTLTIKESQPTVGHQGWTVVLRDFRGNRLGQWLKAAMVQRLRAERPDVCKVRTGNANSNAPMLHINHQLGFRAWQSETIWQLPLAVLAERLTAASR